MRMKSRLFGAGAALCFLALTVQTLWAQQTETIGLRLDVDKRQVEVGDNLVVSIEFKQLESGNSTASGEPSIATPEHFEIRGQSTATQVSIINQKTAMISTTRLTLVATKPGDETLGPALLIFQDPQGNKREIKSNVVTVTVIEKKPFSLFGSKKSAPSPTPETAPQSADEPRDVKPLMQDSGNGFRIVFWLVVALVIAGFVWWKSRGGEKTTAAQEIPLGKAAQLRESWKKLGNEDLSSKEYCLLLSSLVRECLQYRFDFPAVHSTTEEILRTLEKVKATENERSAAEKLLKTCDRVLHADGNLTGRDSLKSLCSALLPKAQNK